jgi:hypothetical protein
MRATPGVQRSGRVCIALAFFVLTGTLVASRTILMSIIYANTSPNTNMHLVNIASFGVTMIPSVGAAASGACPGHRARACISGRTLAWMLGGALLGGINSTLKFVALRTISATDMNVVDTLSFVATLAMRSAMRRFLPDAISVVASIGLTLGAVSWVALGTTSSTGSFAAGHALVLLALVARAGMGACMERVLGGDMDAFPTANAVNSIVRLTASVAFYVAFAASGLFEWVGEWTPFAALLVTLNVVRDFLFIASMYHEKLHFEAAVPILSMFATAAMESALLGWQPSLMHGAIMCNVALWGGVYVWQSTTDSSAGGSEGGSAGRSAGGSEGGSAGGSEGGSAERSAGGSEGGSAGRSEGGSEGGSAGGSAGGSEGGSAGGSEGGSEGETELSS